MVAAYLEFAAICAGIGIIGLLMWENVGAWFDSAGYEEFISLDEERDLAESA